MCLKFCYLFAIKSNSVGISLSELKIKEWLPDVYKINNIINYLKMERGETLYEILKIKMIKKIKKLIIYHIQVK